MSRITYPARTSKSVSGKADIVNRNKLLYVPVVIALLLAALACSAAAANRAFSVSIQSPGDGALLPVDMPTTIAIQGNDPAGSGVQYVELFVDGESRWTSDETLAPQGTLNAEVTWTPDVEGDHTLMAIAYRADGSASPPMSVGVTVVALTALDESGGDEAGGAEATDEPAGEATAEASSEPAGAPPPGANAPVDASSGGEARWGRTAAAPRSSASRSSA